MLNPETLDWDKMDGLLPAIVQDAYDGRVLMQAYMSLEALTATMESGLVTFWSRSRSSLWVKGETSGNLLELVSVHGDCDKDCLLVLAKPKGPVCHLGTATCFDASQATTPELGFLSELENTIIQRDTEKPANSYTSRLLNSGAKRIAQKVGEEGVETALAGAAGDKEELLNEAADLVYHLLVLLRARGSSLSALTATLKKRHMP